MKKLVAYILLMVFAAQTFGQGLTLLNFYINQAYIAKNQCENRFRPRLHCNGNCVLSKKLNQQEKKESQNPQKKLQSNAEMVSSRSFFVTNIDVLFDPHSHYLLLNCAATVDRPASIFHPPC